MEEKTKEKYIKQLEDAYAKEKKHELEELKDPLFRDVKIKEVELEISNRRLGISQSKMEIHLFETELETLEKIK